MSIRKAKKDVITTSVLSYSCINLRTFDNYDNFNVNDRKNSCYPFYRSQQRYFAKSISFDGDCQKHGGAV